MPLPAFTEPGQNVFSSDLNFWAKYSSALRRLKAGQATGKSRAAFGSGGTVKRLPAFKRSRVLEYAKKFTGTRKHHSAPAEILTKLIFILPGVLAVARVNDCLKMVVSNNLGLRFPWPRRWGLRRIPKGHQLNYFTGSGNLQDFLCFFLVKRTNPAST
jgi:hypothetical protein